MRTIASPPSTLIGLAWVFAAVLGAPLASAQAPCPPLPPATPPIIDVYPSQADSLRATVAGAFTGTTVLLHDGYYDMSGGDSSHRLRFDTPGVTLRSASGDREAVVLDGGYGTNELISIYASNTTIADLTLTRAYDHPIHISGPGSPISGILIHNVHVIDPGQQGVKVNPDVSGAGTTEDSTFQCSHIELTDTGRPYIRDNCYTGGIDVHAATGWVVWRNRIEGFWCNDGLSEHGIHFWRASVDTIVEGNVVLDCARGIGFGLGSSMSDGHIGGIIRNNFVAADDSGLFASPDGFDTGIGLESASGTEVYHNTVVSTQAPVSSSIEWRWPNTVVEIANNLVSHDLVPRDGATATLTTNIDSAPLAWFADPSTGDLHLVADGSAPVGAATPLAAGLCDGDIDGQARDFEPDVGADEFGQYLFADGFESGDTTMWTNVVP